MDVADAQARLEELVYTENRGPRLDATSRTVGDTIKEWLDTEARLTLAEGTWIDYESTCRNHLMPGFAAIKLRELTSGQVERWRAAKRRAGTGVNVLGKATLRLSQVCEYAIRHTYLNHNPVKALRPLREEHREMQIWTPPQAARFLRHANLHVYHPIWLLALHTGMRRGELLGLQWFDVDLDAEVLRVRRSMDRSGPVDVKGRQARSIDLTAEAVRALREHKTAQRSTRLQAGPSWVNPQLICSTGVGTHINENNITRAMAILIARAGVPRIRFHDLRHTCGSLMLARGVPVHVVSRQLGHANAAITLKVYAHVMEGQGKAAAAVLDRVYAGE